MLPDRVSNPGPLIYKSGALPIALRGPALVVSIFKYGCQDLHVLVIRILATVRPGCGGGGWGGSQQ